MIIGFQTNVLNKKNTLYRNLFNKWSRLLWLFSHFSNAFRRWISLNVFYTRTSFFLKSLILYVSRRYLRQTQYNERDYWKISFFRRRHRQQIENYLLKIHFRMSQEKHWQHVHNIIAPLRIHDIIIKLMKCKTLKYRTSQSTIVVPLSGRMTLPREQTNLLQVYKKY